MAEDSDGHCLFSRLPCPRPSAYKVLVHLTRDKARTSLPSRNGVESLKDSDLFLVPELNLETLFFS